MRSAIHDNWERNGAESLLDLAIQVVERRCRLRFALETPQGVGICGRSHGQEFEGDVTMQLASSLYW